MLLLFLAFACDRAAEVPDPPDGTPAPTEIPDPDPTCETDVLDAVGEDGALLLEERVVVTLSAADDAWMACVSPDDPDELHLVESSGAATSHELVVRGLLAATTYDCTVRTGCGGEAKVVRFETGTPSLPRFEATSSGAGPSGAYTLFNTQQGGFSASASWLVIVDPEGRVRWVYRVGEDLITDLDATLIDADTLHVGGGWGIFDFGQPNRGVFRTIDLSGNVVVERTEPEYGLGFNHHSAPLADGSYLSLTGTENVLGDRLWYGVGIEHWRPDDGLLWSWSSQQLVDAGVEPAPEPGDDLPYHANSVKFHTDALGDAVYVSLYGAKAIWRLDRATGERTHVFGADGTMSLVDVAGDPLPASEWSYVQHDPDYTADGRVLMYDNGQGRPGGSYSRVAEYALDLAADEATLLWTWTEPGWYDPIVGDADYLPNGNVLITQGYSFEWSGPKADVSELVELSPPDEVVWRLTWTASSYITFRASRHDGCAVFANARYCAAVADRVAVLRGEAPGR